MPEDSPGNFFAVEKYFLDKRRLNAIKQKHINTVLKLACYVNVSLDGEPEEATSPIKIANAMRERPVFIRAGDALVVSEHDDTHMTLFNACGDLPDLVGQLCASEGLFLWKPED